MLPRDRAVWVPSPPPRLLEGVAGQVSCTTLSVVLCFGAGVVDLGWVEFAGLGVGVRQVVVGLVGRSFGAQLGTLFGGPCRETLAFMD